MLCNVANDKARLQFCALQLASGEESAQIALTANQPRSIHIKGTVVTSAAGDFQLKWAQFASNAAATTVMAGSYLRAQEI
jgi:hypothetical protein